MAARRHDGTTAGAAAPREPISSVELQENYVRLFDFAWYRYRYDDAPADPVSAFRQFRAGVREEGRNPNGFFLSSWYMEQNPQLKQVDVDPFMHFLASGLGEGLRPHPIIDTDHIARTVPGIASHIDLMKLLVHGDGIDRTSVWFSRDYYRRHNPDLAAVRDLESHFITHGARERRNPSRDYRVLPAQEYDSARVSKGPEIDRFEWAGDAFVVIPNPVADTIFDQIYAQGEIDPAIFAPGPLTLPSLNLFDGTDIETRDLIDYRGLLREFRAEVDVVILLPRLGIGGGEKYAAQLARTLSKTLRKEVAILVTDSFDDENAPVLRSHSLSGFRHQTILSFHKHAHRTWKKPNVLALLLLALKPEAVFCINSDTGNATIAQYGRALSHYMKLFTTFFSESPQALGAPFSAIYLDAVIGHAGVLSDNENALATFRRRLPTALHPHLHLLPQYCDDKSVPQRRRPGARAGMRKLLWIGRWEAFKNVDFVVELARRDPDTEIHLFSPQEIFPPLANIAYRGRLDDLRDLEIDDYDAFLFTSRFEGMPNIVLEMALTGLPVIAPEVGGLRETFRKDGLFFYSNRDTEHGTPVDQIERLLGQIRKLSAERLAKRTATARAEVAARHGAAQFAQGLRRLLGEE
jgi:glycosyltransferase involved in cell wall biosynthesis